MSNIPLKGGDGNDDIETADKTKDNPAKMSECWKNLSTSWKVGIPLIITGAILIVVGVIVGSTVGESKQGPLLCRLSKWQVQQGGNVGFWPCKPPTNCMSNWYFGHWWWGNDSGLAFWSTEWWQPLQNPFLNEGNSNKERKGLGTLPSPLQNIINMFWACMDNWSSWSTQDCSQDSFAGVNVGSEYLKYKIIPDSFNLLSWAGAQKKCEDEGATMWEVMNEVEWNKIYRILEDKNRNIIWINGKSTAECNDPQKVGRYIFQGNKRQCGTEAAPLQNKPRMEQTIHPAPIDQIWPHRHFLPTYEMKELSID